MTNSNGKKPSTCVFPDATKGTDIVRAVAKEAGEMLKSRLHDLPRTKCLVYISVRVADPGGSVLPILAENMFDHSQIWKIATLED